MRARLRFALNQHHSYVECPSITGFPNPQAAAVPGIPDSRPTAKIVFGQVIAKASRHAPRRAKIAAGPSDPSESDRSPVPRGPKSHPPLMRMRAGQRATEQDRSLFTYLFFLLFFVFCG